MLFLAVCQFFYQMAFIKCQYTDDYLLTIAIPENNSDYWGKLSFTHNFPEDVKLLLQKICGFFATKMA